MKLIILNYNIHIIYYKYFNKFKIKDNAHNTKIKRNKINMFKLNLL